MLDWNEGTTPPSPHVTKTLEQYIHQGKLNIYPDTNAMRLRQSISRYVDVPSSNITIFNGSDCALATLFQTFLNAKRQVLTVEPTYTQIQPFIQIQGAQIRRLVPKDIFNPGTEEISEHIQEGVDIVYLANPNNPTGNYFSYDQIRHLTQKHQTTLFIVDEAYIEFCGSQASAAKLINDSVENLAVLRTFSKAFCLASLRIGYLIAGSQITKQVAKIRNGKDVNSLGQIAAMAALDDLQHTEKHVEEVISTKNWFAGECAKLNIRTTNTPANFILLHSPETQSTIQKLLNRRILVRDRSMLPGMNGMIRITIGTKEEMQRVLNVLKEEQ